VVVERRVTTVCTLEKPNVYALPYDVLIKLSMYVIELGADWLTEVLDLLMASTIA
jgi:hypothetical protein